MHTHTKPSREDQVKGVSGFIHYSFLKQQKKKKKKSPFSWEWGSESFLAHETS